MICNIVVILLIFSNPAFSQLLDINAHSINILVLSQNNQDTIPQLMDDVMAQYTILNKELEINYNVKTIDEFANETFSMEDLCDFYENGYGLIIDVSWKNPEWNNLSTYATSLNMPYLKIDMTLGSALRVLDAHLEARNATDVTVIFENNIDAQEAMYHWANQTSLRLMLLDGILVNNETLHRLNHTQVIPSFYAVVTNTKYMTEIIQMAQKRNVFRFPERWILLFLDIGDTNEIKRIISGKPVSLVSYEQKMCCAQRQGNDCTKCTDVNKMFFINFVLYVLNILNDLSTDVLGVPISSSNCSAPSNFSTKVFYEYLNMRSQSIFTMDENSVFTAQVSAVIELGKKSGNFVVLGKYNDKDKLVLEPGMNIKPNKKFYRVATGIATPWIYREPDPETGKIRLSGYCIDFIEKLAEVMDFDYELGVTDGVYGVKQRNGSWDGLIGGLMNGQIDIVVAPMTMTAEREEVVDFVTPYFATTGITIVTRKPVAKASLFKFLTVLRLEVWLCVIAALVITALMLWILDYCSPLSSKNNKYPHACRKFDLKECFWFALTSFTPQGGGEAPMSLSGRTLVAAYWVFVVLILATFTANLSAFLTVERMQLQIPQYTLDMLSRQSRVNFTVIEGSWPLAYFRNMRNTENELYKLWKQLALNASTDQYRVWDYPIKEEYGYILKAIREAKPVKNVSEGYRMVLEHTDADFAFVHDYSEIRYAIARMCYLVEVGEPFAERPYAVAVQQGSQLLEDVSKAISNLQKEGYFEYMKEKYWNTSNKGDCPEDYISEGIAVTSLGGVFIATLSIVALAIITLIVETFQIFGTKQDDKTNKVKPKTNKKELFFVKKDPFEKNFERHEPAFGHKSLVKSDSPKQVTIGQAFRPVVGHHFKDMGVTVIRGNYITVKSRPPLRYDDLGNENKLYY